APGQEDTQEEAPPGKDDILRRLARALEQRAQQQAEAEAEAEAEGGDPDDQDGDSDGDGEGEDGGESTTPSQQPGGGAGDAPGLPDDPDGFDGREMVDVPEEILEAIAEALELELQDLTQEVAEILDLPPQHVAAQAKKARYDQRKAQATASRVQKQVAEVRRVFDQQNQSASRQLKGLERGKVDGRRLARVGAGDLHVFQRKQVLGKPDMDVGLVLDVSGSMNGHLRVVDETAAIFAEALSHKQGVNFAAWAYTGGQARVQLTRLCDRQMGKLHLADVDHGGGTPSGAAIAACKVLMDRMPSKRKLLLHFTDGDPDSVYHVEAAVKECRKAGLAVHAIALAGISWSRLDYQYGRGNWQVIQRVADLPKAVMDILKQLD
ncbi:MAG: VWA domain-containing protein, partial [Gemmatimonadales bacterium]